MARPTFHDAVAALQQSPTADAQLAALKHLKTELVGHTAKKRDFIRYGVLDVLAQTLLAAAKARGKRREQSSSNGEPYPPAKPPTWVDDDEIQLQALLVLGSVTQGGPEYVAPILASTLVPLLIDALHPTNNPSKIVAASLKALLNLAQADRYAGPRSETLQTSPVMDLLYSNTTIRTFADILMQRSHTSSVQNQLSYLCQFFTATCSAEYHCNALVSGGILDLLGARLAAYHAHQRFFPVRLHPSTAAALPPPPTPQNLSHLLSAITTILNHSKYRVVRLLRSPPVMSVFPFHKPDAVNDPFPPNAMMHSANGVNPLELRLPQSQLKSDTGFARAFPALGSLQASNRQATFPDMLDNSSSGLDSASPQSAFESSVVCWLLVMFREERGVNRLHVADLLATINSAGFVNKSREKMLATLVIPPLLDMIDPKMHVPAYATPGDVDSLLIAEKAPIVLGNFLEKNARLQNAAVDGNVLKKVGQLLKQSLEPFEPRPPVWLANESHLPLPDPSPSRKLGAAGLRPELVHLLRCRTAALSLVAAIAEKDDKYRKQLTEIGIVAHIIDSMAPFKEGALAEVERHAYSANKQKIQPALLGNSIEVLLAACSAARALSRSVALLRTSLIDVGMAKPVIALLRHPNVMIVKAATDVVCNIITDFSPMREDFIAAGSVKTLCEHAHSADSTIRLVSLWALKHLMLRSQNDVKLTCFEELGPGWLIQIMNGGANSSRTSKAASHPAMGAANAAGERINILNAVDEPMDTAEDGPGSDITGPPTTQLDTTLIDDTILGFLVPSTTADADFTNLAPEYRSRLQIIKDAEDRFTASQAYADELKIQSQGLDFIRNMILPPKAGDIIDELLRTLGGSTIFDIIVAKFKSAPLPPIVRTSTSTTTTTPGAPGTTNTASTTALPTIPTTTSTTTTTPSTSTFPSTTTISPAEQDASRDMIDSAINILVHICAGDPRHRQLVISQPALLRALLPLLSHPDPVIRSSAVWVPINLTWCDNDADRAAARQRALELRKLGFEERLRERKDDEAIDVKQRVATARNQMAELLEGGIRGGREVSGR